jgi:hypothetical protein
MILNQILFPAHQVDILKQHFDLAPHEQAFDRRIVEVDIGNVEFLERVRSVGFSQRGVTWAEAKVELRGLKPRWNYVG